MTPPTLMVLFVLAQMQPDPGILDPGSLNLNLLSNFVFQEGVPTTAESTSTNKIIGIISGKVPLPRPNSPLPVEVRITCDQPTEGLLRLRMMSDGRVVYVLDSTPRILPQGSTALNAFLPPVPAAYNRNRLQSVDAFFVSGKKDTYLGSLLIPPHAPRVCRPHVAMCTDGDPVPPEELAVVCALKPETSGGRPVLPGDVRSADRAAAVLRLEDIPESPVHWCAYDLVCVFPRAFVRMRRSQLQALATWVRAGGRALVIHGNLPLRPHHIDFLNLLADPSSGRPWFITDAGGNLAVADRPADDVSALSCLDCGTDRRSSAASAPNRTGVCFRSGIGLAAILPSIPSEGLMASDAGRRFIEHISPDLDGFIGHWQESLNAPGAESLVFSQLLSGVLMRLPLWLMVAMLLAFVVLIGPAEFLVLRRLRRPRLTWVVFPVTSVVFTVALVQLANWKIGRDASGRTLILMDAGRNGEIVRYSRFDLTFARNPSRAALEISGAMFTAVPFGPDAATLTHGSDSPIVFSGNFPNHYTATYRARQWVPFITRRLGFGSPPDIPSPKWPGIVECRRNMNKWMPAEDDPSIRWLATRLDPDTRAPPPAMADPLFALGRMPSVGPDAPAPPFAPTGGNTARDIAVFNLVDPSLVFVTMVRTDGKTTLVYRRTYRDRDTRSNGEPHP